MTTENALTLIDQEAEKQEAESLEGRTCPRCGIWNLDGVRVRNALSRVNNATLICSNCGTEEAIHSITGTQFPLEWHIVKTADK